MAEFIFDKNKLPAAYREGNLFRTNDPYISIEADSLNEAINTLTMQTGIPAALITKATTPSNPNRPVNATDISRGLGTPFRQVPTESLARITETDLNTPFFGLTPQALIEDALERIGTPTNPFAGVTTPGRTPTLMVGGTVTRPSLIQGAVEGLGAPYRSIGDGDSADGGTDGGADGGADGGTVAATPTEGFLAVLSAIQSMADVAPGGLFNLNALLAAITANPSVYLIEETTPITNPDGTTTYIKNQVINPVVAQLLDLQASGQTNLTNIELQRIIQTANVDIKRIEGENAVNLAKENNASAEEIQRIQSAAQEAVGLAEAAATETTAKYGATSPFGALAGAGASVDEVSRLAESLARGGMNPQDAIRQALATTGGAYGALGGIADGYTAGDIAMLARGGLTPEQQLAQARVQALPGLATISPQSLGGLSAILGQEAVRGLFSPFTGQAQQPQTVQQLQAMSPSRIALGGAQQPFSTMQTMGGTMGAPTPTLGQYERLTPFEQGVAGANIAATGKDIEQSIFGVTPGSTAARGSLAAQAL